MNALKEGKVDLAVVSASLQVEQPLKMKVVKKYKEILIGGSRFEELRGRKTSLKELSAYPWISLTSEAITRKFLNAYFTKNGLQFSPDVELATTDMILPAVRYNMGIGFLPKEFAKEDLAFGKVFEIDVNERFPERSIILIHDTEYPQSIASKAFQKFLAERE